MRLGALVTIATAIVGFAIVSVAVTSPNLSGIISAIGNAFSSAIKAAGGH